MARPKSSAGVTLLDFDQEAMAKRIHEVSTQTDDEIICRLAERFSIMDDMTKAVKAGDVKAMIVSGPPGCGKSFSVERILESSELFNKMNGKEPKYEVVKGNLSALGLYAKLFEFSDKGDVLVFDDADCIFFDPLALNILKAALDSNDHRYISWNTDSRLLRTEEIPNRFEFCGSVIFITNIKFAHVKSKTLKAHLDALESRCHYIDLEIDTAREKLLRIKQIVNAGMLNRFYFSDFEKDEIVQFIEHKCDSLRELSLRMVLKIADLRKSFPLNWMQMSNNTCMRR